MNRDSTPRRRSTSQIFDWYVAGSTRETAAVLSSGERRMPIYRPGGPIVPTDRPFRSNQVSWLASAVGSEYASVAPPTSNDALSVVAMATWLPNRTSSPVSCSRPGSNGRAIKVAASPTKNT